MDASSADSRSLTRAACSVGCLPFRRAFYAAVAEGALSSTELCARPDMTSLVFSPVGPGQAENHFIWLIQLGVLRREVDGQGLTERVRLTPMGRQLLARWPGEIPRAGLRQQIAEQVRRHRPRR